MRRDAPGALITQPNRDPRIALGIIYPTGSIYLTNRPGIANVPGNVVEGVLKEISSTSQTLYPDQGRSEIGTLSFTAVDLDEALTDELRTQLLVEDRGLNLREVRVYTGDTDDFDDWQDQRVATYVINGVSRKGRSYHFSCADRTREQRVSIFEQQKTRLSATITATATTINVLSTSGFEMLAHTSAFTDAPSSTVGYFKIKQTGEVVRYTGKTATSFTGCTRARFNTVAQPVTVEATEDDRKPEIEEFIYLEMPAPDMLHSIQTGVIMSSSAAMPSSWHMGIDEAFVDAAGYEAIGSDLYDPANPAGGLVLRFLNLKKEDGKKFVEEQLHVPMGTYPTVDTMGVLGIRRIASILATSTPAAVLYPRNIIDHGDVTHALSRVINRVVINWNHDGEDFTRTDILRNENSIAVHGPSKPLTLNLRGLFVSGHSSTTINRIFNYITERYGAPPIEAEISVSRALNNLEIGDVAQLVLERVPDFTGATYLNRAVEVQSTNMNWKTGRPRIRVFASTARTLPDAGAGTAPVLPDGYYTGTGTNLTSVLTIVGNAVTTNGAITGGADARTAVFYYNGNLTINAGVTVTITGNVQLRIKGTLTINGSIDGAGGGLDGLEDPNTVSASMIDSPDQFGGFIGASRGSAGIRLRTMVLTLPVNADSVMPPISRGINASFPPLSVAVESGALAGLPAELRGAPGGWGGTIYSLNNDGTHVVRALGGDGGDGGAGLLLICRGLAFGVSGEIDLSGGNGAAGGTYVPGITLNAGGGGGGAPGALYVLLDGDNVTYPDLSAAFLASQGSTPQTGTPMAELTMRTSYLPTGSTGMDPGTPVEDRWEPHHRVLYVPSNIALGASDDEIVPAPAGLSATADGAGVLLQWTSPAAELHDYIQVWEATTNDRTGALLLSSRKASSLFVSKASSVTRYYWIRSARERSGLTGYSAWHPAGATSGVSATFGGATGPAGDDAISVSVSPDFIQWVQAPNGGSWAPASTTSDVTFTFSQGGATIATHVVRATRSSATISAATQSETGAATTETISGNGTGVVNVRVTHDASGISNAITFTTVQGGSQGPQGNPGVDGDDGAPGADGADGADGIDASNWTFTGTFSSSSATVVAWTSGTLLDTQGNSQSIGAGNTGTMAALTYIYWDPAAPTVLSVTTTASTAVGGGKILIAVARNTSAATQAYFQAFGGTPTGVMVTADQIAAATIVGSKVVTMDLTSKTLTADTGTVGGWTLAASKLSAGNVHIDATNEQIRLGSATAPMTGIGIFAGKDGSDYEWRAGDPAGQYIHWDGAALAVAGALIFAKVQTFTPTYAGFSSAPSGDLSYIDAGNFVIMWNGTGSDLTGTSNSTSFSITNIPSAIRPSASAFPGVLVQCRDNGNVVYANPNLDSSGTMNFPQLSTSGSVLVPGGLWTNSGTKGFRVGASWMWSKIP